MMKLATRVLAAIVTLFFGAGQTNAGMVLTSAAVSDGFALSTFATGFPNSNGVGPTGIAFPSAGGVLVSDFVGNVRHFATDVDGQNASAAPVGQNYGTNNALGLAVVGNNIYMTQFTNGRLVQINSDGTFNQTILTGLSGPAGVVANPNNGHLFVSNQGTNQILDVDPIAKTKTVFVSGTSVPDGLSISPDGSDVYVASFGSGHILGFDTTTKAEVFDSGFIAGGVDGTTLGTGSLAGNIFVNTNSGTLVEVNLATHVQTLIGTGGSRGDFVTVDPNGTLLLTQTSDVLRLTAPPGGGFGPTAAPEPCSLALVGSGVACIVGYGWPRRKRSVSA